MSDTILRAPWLPFVGGVLSTLVLLAALLALRRARRENALKRDVDTTCADAQRLLQFGDGDPRDVRATEVIAHVGAVVLTQPRLNPEWVTPLTTQLPQLVREIAQIYYPSHPEPVFGPGVSEFARFVEVTARDVAEFLQTKRSGRLLDVSAKRAVDVYRVSRRVAENQWFKTGNKWYKRARPIYQMLWYNSPTTYVSLAARNAAARSLHVYVVNLVGRRAIELYSGRLTLRSVGR